MKEEKKESNKWLKQLRAYDDVVDFNRDAFAEENCLFTPSPYWNWIFANKSNGIPNCSSILMFSQPKSGKSFGCNAIIAEMHQRDKEGHALYFNTEIRGKVQQSLFKSTDPNRLTVYDTNEPKNIFDRIEMDIKPMVQDGFPLRIIVLDSLSGIIGVKRLGAESVEDHLIGDKALTLSIGLQKLVPFCKQNNILLIGTAQLRANVDAMNKYAPKEKMESSFAAKHAFEYFISYRSVSNTDQGKLDLEVETEDEDPATDIQGNSLGSARKIYVKMEESSIGPAGRSGVFTLDFKNGIINQFEEIFWLGKNTGVIQVASNNREYSFNGQKFNGKKECALAIRDNPELAQAILTAVKKLDDKE
jgi:RecA/RadA recombinase